MQYGVRIQFLAIFLWLTSFSSLAVELDQSGMGQVLIFPFFTTDNGWDTYINLTLGEGQVLKVRVKSSEDGSEVNSFSIYSSPSENWGAAITQDASGQPVLRIAEGTCTISDQMEFGGVGTDFPLGAGVGSLEVYVVSSRISSVTAESIMDCGGIAARWDAQGEWADDPTAGMGPSPHSALFGEASLVNVQQGLASTYTALSLRKFADNVPHTSPADMSPNLADAEPIVDTPSLDGFVPHSGEGIDAVAIALGLGGLSTVTNQVVNLPDIQASTDWVLSYPLAGYKNYKPYTVVVEGGQLNCETFGLLANSESELVAEAQLDEAQGALESWGFGTRKGGETSTLDPPPLIDVELALCSAVNVVSFDGVPSILAEENASYLTQLYDVLANESSSTLKWRPVEVGRQDIKRPVVGFRLTTFANGTLNGGNVLANYAILRPHVRQ